MAVCQSGADYFYWCCHWSVPDTEEGVKRKKRYRAYLYTESVEKEYQQEKQWAVFSFEPQQAIFYLDSTMYLIQQGELALYLPIGMHACRVESPFYQPLSDTIELSDTVRLEKHFTLKTYYAYLTVQTSFPDAVILLDNKPIGKGQADTGRLRPGEYRLTVKREDGVYYDRTLELGNAERKVVDLRKVALRPHLPTDARLAERTEPTRTTEETPAAPPDSLSVASERPFEIAKADSASVSIRAFDDETEIWLNRQWVGKGSWQGRLAPGFYAISSQKEGLDSRTAYFWVEAGETVELNLASPLTDYGSLNVSCDEVNARIFLNGVEVGLSPRVLSRLPADRTYRLRMVKGKKEAEKRYRHDDDRCHFRHDHAQVRLHVPDTLDCGGGNGTRSLFPHIRRALVVYRLQQAPAEIAGGLLREALDEETFDGRNDRSCGDEQGAECDEPHL